MEVEGNRSDLAPLASPLHQIGSDFEGVVINDLKTNLENEKFGVPITPVSYSPECAAAD